MSRAEVHQLAGAFGDPFRAIEILPGVTPIISGLPFFYVRGAPPGNTGYFLDGVRVPYLYHVAVGPSIVNPAMVERVDLYSGGYPARFGRYAGAIVSAETTAPRDDLHGETASPLRRRRHDRTGLRGRPRHRLSSAAGFRTAALFSLFSPTTRLEVSRLSDPDHLRPHTP
jgi:outer membrane receptor protein involved in Fe transport